MVRERAATPSAPTTRRARDRLKKGDQGDGGGHAAEDQRQREDAEAGAEVAQAALDPLGPDPWRASSTGLRRSARVTRPDSHRWGSAQRLDEAGCRTILHTGTPNGSSAGSV
jgi:hypothetical protein